MTNLYFLNSKNEQELVVENVDKKDAGKLALDDLSRRKPEIISYYQRYWEDDHNRMWIDYGSHTEFYIVQEPEMARNLVEKVEHSCNNDYCDL